MLSAFFLFYLHLPLIAVLILLDLYFVGVVGGGDIVLAINVAAVQGLERMYSFEGLFFDGLAVEEISEVISLELKML